jgi:hypothetical protein
MSTASENKSIVSVAPLSIIGTPAYYQWRHDDFVVRNPNHVAPDYYLGYGMKYALRFQNKTNGKLSARGQKWMSEVMINLQILMENRLSQPDGAEFERNAQALYDFGFASHVKAYWNENGTTPLYVLSISDLFLILFTPDFRDLVTVKSVLQIVAIVKKLGRYWWGVLMKCLSFK